MKSLTAPPLWRILSTFAVIAIIGVLALPGVVQAEDAEVSPSGRENIKKLNTCIDNKKKADLIFVIDESASLKGHGGKPATDPNNIRVPAMQDLVTQLGKFAQESNADINVKLSGFGQGYRSQPDVYGGWVNVRDHAGDLTPPIQGFDQRNNDVFTDYGTALNGAMADLASRPDQESCKAILFFTDGKLTVQGDQKADIVAQKAICSADGQVKKLRDANIQLFTVGLIPSGEESPEQILRSMSEGNDCAIDTVPNGAFFNAESNAASLFSAFRSILPNNAVVEHHGNTASKMRFMLDNSITEVRISAVPNEIVDNDALIPVLITPRGKEIPLKGSSASNDDVSIKVERGDSVPGMVDITMSKDQAGDWAGEWLFGYQAKEGTNTQYSAKAQIFPGLTTVAEELNDKEVIGLSNNEVIHVALVNRDGQPQKLEGEAKLEAKFAPADGSEPINLIEPTSIGDGFPVVVPLKVIDKPSTGEITLSTAIVTKGKDNKPGTQLTPVVARYPVAISPSNFPKVAGQVDIKVNQLETQVSVPVEGPGKLWIDEKATGTKITTPEGATPLKFEAPNNSSEKALTLQAGQKGSLPLIIRTDKLVDGPIAVNSLVKLESLKTGEDGEVAVQFTGTMQAPVNKPVFAGVFVLVLILAILIPLIILYLIKYLTGLLVQSTLHAKSIPVAIKNGRLVREDTGQNLTFTFDELVLNTPGVKPQSREVVLAGKKIRARYGFNPFSSAYAAAEDGPSIGNLGRQVKGRAKLPLALRRTWVLYADKYTKDKGQLLVIVDPNIQQPDIDALAAEAQAKAKDYFDRFPEPAPADADGADGPHVAASQSTGAKPDPFGDAPSKPQPPRTSRNPQPSRDDDDVHRTASLDRPTENDSNDPFA